MSEKNFRIRTNINKDKVVHVNLSQEYDFLEILSLKINQLDTYKLHVSNYGVIVGRVLANENFGIPNAKVSVFIELDDNDLSNSEITNIYPYKTIQDIDNEGVRYNLLPDQSNDICYKVVGTFPNKRLVLDDDTQIEIFEKYWKYTTVTNKSGDYMIYGVPTGKQNIHVDIDLSDIGILSQKPIDFMYKGYNETQFDNARQFKDGKNLDNLSQILSQDNSVNVYPFWGDKNLEDIAITRCDIQVQYKFETTCVFFGSIVSDNYNNNIGHRCSPSKHAGFNRHLVTGEGTIEMIRKTPDNLVEEYQIQGNRLIDSDGVWCYQIPMNLDYVGTDEFGNIVPTDDVKKGIATRTSVRFRVSMQETSNEGISRHRAKYLIPNVQKVVSGNGDDLSPHIENSSSIDQCYEFGSATPDEYFRDLYWNKVYSIKNYIPRIQTNGKRNTQNYSAIRTVNSNGNLNPVPFNHARFRLVFAYRVLCMIMTIVVFVIGVVNSFTSNIVCKRILGVRPFKFLCNIIKCISISGGITEDIEDNVEYFPRCKRSCGCMMKCNEGNCEKRTDSNELMNLIQQTLSQEYDTVNLDFYNDWLNGCLYLPLWYWKKTKKKKFLFGLFSKKAVNTYCSCSNHYSKLRVTQNCSLVYDSNYNSKNDMNYDKYHEEFPAHSPFTYFGIIKEFKNRDGLNVYYYAPGLANTYNYKINNENNSYVRLYSTDIILLGSLNSCDLDNYPNVFTNLPSTTANVPFIATIKQHSDDENEKDKGYVEVTGMDWLHKAEDSSPKYGAGLFMDLACNYVNTRTKSCINVERLSELGVSYDAHEYVVDPENGNLIYNDRDADGLITRFEINDNETRAMFASLNNNGLTEKIFNPNTGYSTYKLRYIYPIDFDGHLSQEAPIYTSMMPIKTYDNKNDDYIHYRFGMKDKNDKPLFYSKENNGYSFPLFNNSFYFYFGLNEGNTAIDKFNKKFYSSCYKNYRYPFTMNITNEPGKWCKSYDANGFKNDFGTIKIKLNGIKIPYSYTLYNEFNEEIMNEENMTIESLMFGYKIDKENGGYAKDGDDFIKDGRLAYYNTGEYVLDKNNENYYLNNGTYRIKITDVNGNSTSNVINVEQIKLSMIYESYSLGEKYYENSSKKEDFCSDSNKYGEIIIKSIILDGHEYKIDTKNIENVNNGEYKLHLLNNKENTLNIGSENKIQVIIKNTTDDKLSFDDCSCGYVENSEYLRFKIWIPGDYLVTLRQYCNDVLNDNMYSEKILINNGEPFNAFINETPIKFILGEDGKNNELYDDDKCPNCNENIKRGWLNLNDEKTYKFPEITLANKDVWSDFIDVAYNEDSSFFSEDTVTEMILYKYNSLFNIARESYISDNNNEYTLYISHKGGKGVILYRGGYPRYEEISEDGLITQFITDDVGVTTADNRYANVVSFNYTYTNDENNKIPLKLLTDGKKFAYNSRISLDDGINCQGNYFAAFTNNACRNNESKECRFKAYPEKANPEASSLCEILGEGGENGKYYKNLFIDKRLDYSFLIFTPYDGNKIQSMSDNNSWMDGRVSGNTFNGIEMAYDKNYNIIGDNLEYNTNIVFENNNKENKIYLIDDKDINNRKFYSATLKSGGKYYNVVDYMHGDKTSIDNGDGFIVKPIKDTTKRVNDYPMIRGFDAHHLKPGNTISFDCKNCSYFIETSIESELIGENSYDYSPYVEGITEEGGGASFNISSRNMIINSLSSLHNSAINNNYNVLFTINNGEFSAKSFQLSFKLNRDNSDNEHYKYTTIPRLFNVMSGTKNNIEDVKFNSNSITDIINKLYDNTIDSFDVSSEFNIYPSYSKLSYGFISDYFVEKFGKLVLDYDNNVVFDDSNEFKNITFSKNINLNNKNKMLSVYFIRNYINSLEDNLTKEISTVQFTSLFDLRNFKLINDSVYLESVNNSMVQYARYKIDVTDKNYNQEFSDFKGLNAEIMINGKVSSNVTIEGSSDGKSIYFNTYWNGDLSGEYITNLDKSGMSYDVPISDKEVNLFVQMPSMLIYNIKFIQRQHSGSIESIPLI